ncbi:serine hydrolase domain-containing protein [Catenulispora rubra]|uniref:serine hydrolase domain-containing protein n=1 Tax=Catenulispora rubra TaxID=280293 RepID=UPI001E3A53EF|nr:serine hydrolase domain-containing protein [Catenulispora rubra]
MISTRRSVLKAGLAGLFVVQGSVAQGSAAFATTSQKQTFDQWLREFEASMPARLAAAHVAGVEVAIVSKNAPTPYAAAFGYADIAANRLMTPDTPVHLASVSKLFTASALVQLFEHCGLDRHDDVSSFIDFPVRNPAYPNVPITPHQLVTHTSSISDDNYVGFDVVGDPTESLSDFLRGYLVPGGKHYAPKKSYLPKHKPATYFSYSDVGMALAGYVVQCVSGQDFTAYAQANLFDPLGITGAHWYLRQFAPGVLAVPYEFKNGALAALPQMSYPDVPSGALRCSVTDLATSLRAMIGGAIGTPPILSAAAVADMLRPQVSPKIVPYQGLGWVQEVVSGLPYVGHSGSDIGFATMVVLTKDQNHAVAVLINTDEGDGSAVSDFRDSVTTDLVHGAQLLG